jgi:hypothetical protein
MKPSFFLLPVVLTLLFVATPYRTAWCQEQAGTRAMRMQAGLDTPRTAQSTPQGLTISCQPDVVVAATIIQYMIPQSGQVSVSIFDEAGNEVAVLDNQKRKAGLHQVIFDRQNLPNGVYYCKVVLGKAEVKQRLVLTDRPE